MSEQKSGSFDATSGVTGMPVDGVYWMGWVEYLRDGRIFVEVRQLNTPGLGSRYSIMRIDNRWTEWLGPIATATPPQWYDVQLLNGYGYVNMPHYYLDGCGYVCIDGVIKREAAPLQGETMFQLPAGYRPRRQVPLLLVSGKGWCTYGYINTDGAVNFSHNTPNTAWTPNDAIAIHVIFRAA